MEKDYIIILGASPTSEALVAVLNQYNHQITLVDQDAGELASIQGKYDINIINQCPSYPGALVDADISHTHSVIALSSSDETNLSACLVAKTLAPDVNTLACLSSDAYLTDTDIANHEAISSVFSYNQSLFEDMKHIIYHPEYTHINHLGNDLVAASLILNEGHPLIGLTLDEACQEVPKSTTIAGLRRDHTWVKYRKNIKLTDNDHLLVITPKAQLQVLTHSSTKYQKLLFLGISGFTQYACEKLYHDFTITVIDQDESVCQDLAMKMPYLTIIHDDPKDTRALRQYIQDDTLVIASSHDDEDNLVFSFQAHEAQASKVFTLINHIRDGHVFEKGPIDYAINAPQVICDEVIRDMLKSKDVSNFYTKHDYLQITKVMITKDHAFLNKCLADIELPEGVYIGGIVRHDQVLFTNKQSRFELGDHLIIYSDHKKHQHNAIEDMFLKPEYLLNEKEPDTDSL